MPTKCFQTQYCVNISPYFTDLTLFDLSIIRVSESNVMQETRSNLELKDIQERMDFSSLYKPAIYTVYIIFVVYILYMFLACAFNGIIQY